jgi:hypothetical protein
MLNLYRIMTDVRAGSAQRNVSSDNLGIVTLWLRARSADSALALAGFILMKRRYAFVGELHAYAEILAHDPLGCSSDSERAADRREDRVLAGYEALKTHAMAEADGLHEVWLGTSVQQCADPGERAAA